MRVYLQKWDAPRQDTTMSSIDLLVVDQVLSLGLMVMTNTAKEFEHVEGSVTENRIEK
jgi:hypothetical protein